MSSFVASDAQHRFTTERVGTTDLISLAAGQPHQHAHQFHESAFHFIFMWRLHLLFGERAWVTSKNALKALVEANNVRERIGGKRLDNVPKQVWHLAAGNYLQCGGDSLQWDMDRVRDALARMPPRLKEPLAVTGAQQAPTASPPAAPLAAVSADIKAKRQQFFSEICQMVQAEGPIPMGSLLQRHARFTDAVDFQGKLAELGFKKLRDLLSSCTSLELVPDDERPGKSMMVRWAADAPSALVASGEHAPRAEMEDSYPRTSAGPSQPSDRAYKCIAEILREYHRTGVLRVESSVLTQKLYEREPGAQDLIRAAGGMRQFVENHPRKSRNPFVWEWAGGTTGFISHHTTTRAFNVTASAADASIEPALMIQQPEATSSTLGKDKATWAELTDSEQVAARILGFAAELWDEGLTPESSFLPFQELRPEARAAAHVLGYTEESWTAELSDVTAGELQKETEWGAVTEAARPAAATWAEESPLSLDAQRLRAAFERDPALWDDLARLVVRVESALK